MIYVEKDFYFNFAEASQDANTDKLRDTVLKEIAELIKKNRRGLVGLMNRTGVSIATSASDKDLVTLLVHNLTSNNQKLIRGVAEMIEAQQSSESNPNAVPLIASGIGATFSLFGKDKETANVKELLDDISGKPASNKTLSVDAIPATTATSSNKLLYFGIAAVVIGVGIYFYYKHHKKK